MTLKQYATWIIHWAISLAIALVGAYFWGKEGWLIGTTVGMLFYAQREIRDMLRYMRQGVWSEYHLSDGVGDFIGPLALWAGAVGSYFF